MTPPSGTSFSAHLLALRRAVGQRRVAISNRNWIPNCIGFNYDIEDLITHSDRMTYLGGSPAELLDQLNQSRQLCGIRSGEVHGVASGLGACHEERRSLSWGPYALEFQAPDHQRGYG